MKKFIILFSFVLFGFNLISISKIEAYIPLSLVSYEISDTEISPNGDGIKDSVDIDIKYSEEVKSGTAKINIIDANGNNIKSLYTNSSDVINPQNKNWNGTDDSDQIVPNGLYTIQILGTALADETNIISDENKSISVNNVISATLSSISITTQATKLNYNVGDNLDISDLVVTGTYSDSSTKTETITAANISGFDSTIPSIGQILTITVGEKTATYAVNINAVTTENITLKIYSGDTVLFNGPEVVTACAESPEVDAPITVNAKCAIEQSGLSNTWTWNYAPSGWLDELGGDTTTPDYSEYWSWFNDLELGGTGLNQHILSNGEELLLTYNSYPLRISASKNSGVIGDQIIFTAEEKSTFDENWNMIWTSSLGVTITLETQSCITVIDGTCSIILDTVGSLNAIGSKSLYVPSASIGIEVSSSNGGGSSISHYKVDTDKALQYLSDKQNPDDSFNSDLYTDWAGIALANTNTNLPSKEKITNYLKITPLISNIATDNERHAMVLMALGINPYSGTQINYIQKIIDAFDGTQFGDPNLFNDDIFAIFPLIKAGYNANDEMMQKNISFILSKQENDGGWGSIDLTTAAIQALSLLPSSEVITQAKAQAEQYLKNSQQADGGFGNSFSTSWALQAISALGEDSSTWTKNNLNPNDYLFTLQQTDGGIESLISDENTRIWATSYAIPAVMNKSWGDIMQSFSKPMTQDNSSAGILGNTDSQISTNPVVCPKGDLFSTTTGQACTKTNETDIVTISTPPITTPNSNPIKKIKDKKIVEIPKTKINIIEPNVLANSPSPILEISTENNLLASAGNSMLGEISIKKISQTIINGVINILTYIGKGFCYLIIFLFNF